MTIEKSPLTNHLNGIIILGSARSDGNTRLVAEQLAFQSGMDIVDLSALEIGYFEYDNYDRGDDFLPLIKNVVDYELLVFATPVYWYNMSAVMKNFFDRITDLTCLHKDLGRQFRTKSMAVLSCSATQGKDEEFAIPFVRTAKYLGMEYKGHLATWLLGKAVSPEVNSLIEAFSKDLSSAS